MDPYHNAWNLIEFHLLSSTSNTRASYRNTVPAIEQPSDLIVRGSVFLSEKSCQMCTWMESIYLHKSNQENARNAQLSLLCHTQSKDNNSRNRDDVEVRDNAENALREVDYSGRVAHTL
jgi:hypothetical protein